VGEDHLESLSVAWQENGAAGCAPTTGRPVQEERKEEQEVCACCAALHRLTQVAQVVLVGIQVPNPLWYRMLSSSYYDAVEISWRYCGGSVTVCAQPYRIREQADLRSSREPRRSVGLSSFTARSSSWRACATSECRANRARPRQCRTARRCTSAERYCPRAPRLRR
jgi:hypothetical protein